MNEQLIRTAVETLESGAPCTCNNPTITCRYCEAVTTVRNCINLVLSIKGVEKKKINIEGIVEDSNEGKQQIYDNGFNNCHDKFTALRAKQLMGVGGVVNSTIDRLLEKHNPLHIVAEKRNEMFVQAFVQAICKLFEDGEKS